MSDLDFYLMIVWTGVSLLVGLAVATLKRTEGLGGFVGFWAVTTAILWLACAALWISVNIKQYIDNYGMPFTGSG
jgi:hypothetical protein